MLGTTNALIFPRLKFLGKVNFGISKKEERNLYKLDWYHLDNKESNMSSLPSKFNNFTKDLTFVISAHYMKAIKHFANLALKERNISWSFDTCIRDNICCVSQACVETAMMLLADCTYDKKREYWMPCEEGRYFVKPLLIFKFWAFQTGRGLVRSKSKIDKLIDHAQESKHFCLFEKAFARELSLGLENLEKEWDKAYRPIADVGMCFEEANSEKISDIETQLSKMKDIKKSYDSMKSFFGEDFPELKELAEKYDFL